MDNQLLIQHDVNVLGGIAVFAGTRVPVKTLFDYLKTNHPLDDFLGDYPTVGRTQAQEVLELSERHLQEFTYDATP